MPAKRRSTATASSSDAPAAGSRGAFRGAATREGGGWGFAGAALLAAGEAQGRWNGEAAFSGVPKARETHRRGRLRAGSLDGEPPRPFAFPLRHHHPKAGGGELSAVAGIYPRDGSRRNVTLAGRDGHGDNRSLPLLPACPPAVKLLALGTKLRANGATAVLPCQWWGAQVTQGLAVPIPACPSRPPAVF